MSQFFEATVEILRELGLSQSKLMSHYDLRIIRSGVAKLFTVVYGDKSLGETVLKGHETFPNIWQAGL